MHEGEVGADPAVVADLIAGQFPEWAGLPITPVPSAGTVNWIYRLGGDMAVRLPRTEAFIEDWDRAQWLHRLAPKDV